jgi:hypothetical protein
MDCKLVRFNVDDLVEGMVRMMASDPFFRSGELGINEFTMLELAKAIDLTGSKIRSGLQTIPQDDPKQHQPNDLALRN